MDRPLRFVTAASLYDGHDASINIMRRVLQDQGVEVIHLGHNRSAEEIVDTAIQEDADAIAVSSYQGGHNEFFRFMFDLLRKKGAPWIKLFGGGGGVIVPAAGGNLHGFAEGAFLQGAGEDIELSIHTFGPDCPDNAGPIDSHRAFKDVAAAFGHGDGFAPLAVLQ